LTAPLSAFPLGELQLEVAEKFELLVVRHVAAWEASGLALCAGDGVLELRRGPCDLGPVCVRVAGELIEA
jgi:hypothetical protein